MVDNTKIESAKHIRWLDVNPDSQLSFEHHVAMWCSKALKIAQYLRRINSVKRGAAPGPLITAVKMCVVPIATFGADVWWPGMTRPAAKGIVKPQTMHLCNLIDKAVHLALRAALPVWRITPNAILHRKSRIAPARILLKGIDYDWLVE